MYRKFPLNGIIVGIAAIAALVLTVTRPSPESLVSFGIGDREVRAAPGKPAASVDKHDLTALEVFNLTLVRVREAYVDPTRIEAKRMLFAALDSVQYNIPEVLVEADEAADQVTIRVNDKRQTFSTGDVDSPWRLSGKLKKMFRFIELHMNPGGDLAQVEYAAVNGMLQTLDPHSVLLDPETAREMKVNTSGKFGGLGIVIRMYERKLTVVRPIKNTPAWEAGLESGDHIVMINNEVTENLTLQEAVDRMRGTPDTSVTLWIERKGEAKPLEFQLSRAIIQVESVESQMLAGSVGYLRIKQFSGRTATEIRDAMTDLRAQGARAWVMDLRWNPGGLLEQAIDVSDLFLDKGTIVTTVGGREREPRRAKRKGSDTSTPLAVLVNGNSASASEIVAGALKNLDRAVIIGSTTFGKGSVQILFDNDDGSQLKLTIAQYLTPGDRSIQSLGIVPDIALQRMFVPKQNKEPKDQIRLLAPSRTYREADLAAHLTSTYATEGPGAEYDLAFLYEPPKRDDALPPEDGEDAPPVFEEEEPLEDEFVEDFEIKMARDLVASIGKPTRSETLEAARQFVLERRVAEHKKLATALTALGIDWRAPQGRVARAEQLSADVDVRVGGTPVTTVRAGDEVELVGTVTNPTDTDAYQVHMRVRSDDRAFDDTELVFGHIPAGGKRTWSTRVKVPEDALDRADRLSFYLREGMGSSAPLAAETVRVVAAERPVFAYGHHLIDDGNADGLIQRGERHRLRVILENSGKGKARNTTALLRNASGDGVAVKKGRFEVGELAPGQRTTLEFEFEVTDQLASDLLVLEMTVYDGVLHESVVEKLKYTVTGRTDGPEAASGTAQLLRGVPVREGASAQASPVAMADKGAIFAITGKVGDWLRVKLAGDLTGFVPADAVRRTREAPDLSRVSSVWQVTPPRLTLSIPTFETDGASYRLEGKATDDTHVEDVFIFVSNREAKIDNKKVFYKSNRNGKDAATLEFSSEIPLWPGSNRVTVVARENDAVKASQTLVLYRGTETATAAAAPAP
jgi:carboxyl-terminal processing protease